LVRTLYGPAAEKSAFYILLTPF